MKIYIDGTETEVLNSDKNIVDTAARMGIGIPAPCYKNGRNGGCCEVCVVEINGKQAYACCTRPAEGMSVIVKRDDLIAIRKERIAYYVQNKNNLPPCTCNCSCGTTSGESCC